ncbi:MAG: PEGA domain-containing protein [Patescibacteria group bacterium]
MTLSLRRRRIYFAITTAVFLVVTPVLIAYSLGYRLTDGIVTKTGGIFIHAEPRGVTITIDDTISKQTGALLLAQGKLISGLSPGEHTVRVEKEGYFSWEKNLVVEEGLVTEARAITLPPRAVHERIVAENARDFVFSDSQALIAFAFENSIGILDTTNGEEITITLDPKERIGTIAFGTGEDYLIVESFLKNITRKRLVNVVTKAFTDIQESETEKFVKVRQYSGAQPQLIALSAQHALLTADINSQQEPRMTAQNVGAFELFGDVVVYATTEPTVFYEKNLITDETTQLTQDPLSGIGVSTTILRSPAGHIAFLNSANELYLYDTEQKVFERVADHVVAAVFSDDSKKLLWHNKNEVYVRYLRTILIQPRHTQGDMELLTRFSKPITGISWFSFDNEHVLFAAEGQLKFTELDGRDRRNTYDIAETITPLKMRYNSYDDALYLLDDTTLKRISLIE